MADREAWDRDAAEVPLDQLLSPEYNAERRALIGHKASGELRPGSPGARTPMISGHAREVAAGEPGFDALAVPGAGEPTVARAAGNPRWPRTAAPGATPATSTSSTAGNMVAATPSGGWLQSNPVVPELGLPARHPAPDGLAGRGGFPILTPGRRPRTTLTPSLALRDGKVPVMAFGTPGGDQQDQWQTHFFLAVALRAEVRGGLDLQGAIDAPNWHNDSFPSSFYRRGMRPGSLTVESRTDGAVVEEACAVAAMTSRSRRPGRGPAVRGGPGSGDGCAVGGGEPAGDAGVRGGPLISNSGNSRRSHRSAPEGWGLSVARVVMEP